MRTRALTAAVLLTGVLAHPTLVSAQENPPAPVVRADHDNDDNWGWLGLLGLAGLLGLRRRERTGVGINRNPRTAP
jgi:MYXO-CTERM domain-containing protein